jgi:hypothetical protein
MRAKSGDINSAPIHMTRSGRLQCMHGKIRHLCCVLNLVSIPGSLLWLCWAALSRQIGLSLLWPEKQAVMDEPVRS